MRTAAAAAAAFAAAALRFAAPPPSSRPTLFAGAFRPPVRARATASAAAAVAAFRPRPYPTASSSSSASASASRSSFRSWSSSSLLRSEAIDPSGGTEGPTLDDVVPHEFDPLFSSASAAAEPRTMDMTDGAHEPFRYEWGTWANETSLRRLMDRVDEVRLNPGSYDRLMDEFGRGGGGGDGGGDDDDDAAASRKGSARPLRLRVAGGEDWACLLHVLPPGTFWRGRHPTGSWAVVRALTGVAEVALLRGPDRDGLYKKVRPRDLRGGGDGTLGGGAASGGEGCVKYVGGPLRSYAGKSGRTAVLEAVVLPPVGDRKSGEDGIGGAAGEGAEELVLEDVAGTFSIAAPMPEAAEGNGEDRTEEKADHDGAVAEEDPVKETTGTTGASGGGGGGGGGGLNAALGMTFENVGGLDDQLESIARRVLASRADPAAARRLGVGHVRGILLSGPPGCGKTLLARELARLLGAREPQIVNGPEILDKFIGEAEKKVRDLFRPAEEEYAQVGDDSALHIVVLDEMDAIARKRGTMTSDTTGVRDSVVNQLLAKMDGVREAPNVLVVGLTNRPELLDPALLRPGRLEVKLRVELPDAKGRRDILRIHTRRMREGGALSDAAAAAIDDPGEGGMAARTEHFSGAELAGLVRSAASFSLARAVEAGAKGDAERAEEDEAKAAGVVKVADLEAALAEVRPALGRQDEALRLRFPRGVSACSPSMERVMRDLERFVASAAAAAAGGDLAAPAPQSLLLVGAGGGGGGGNSVGGGGGGGAGATALAAWAASRASSSGSSDYVRFVTALDVITAASGKGGDEGRAAALADKFAEAREMRSPLLVLDDVDQLCAGSGPGGYSTVVLAALRALLRTPPGDSSTSTTAEGAGGDGGKGEGGGGKGRTMRVIAATSRSDAACVTLHELFDETVVVPLLSEPGSVAKLLSDGLGPGTVADADAAAGAIVRRLGSVGCKTALRLAERAVVAAAAAKAAGADGDDFDVGRAQLDALEGMLEDLAGDEATAERMCEVF